MASYHQLPRSLAGAVKELFNEELSKDTREQMAGLSVEEIQSNQAFVNYALEDSQACLRVYQELDTGFPEKERLLSSLTRRPVDWRLMDHSVSSSSIRQIKF